MNLQIENILTFEMITSQQTAVVPLVGFSAFNKKAWISGKKHFAALQCQDRQTVLEPLTLTLTLTLVLCPVSAPGKSAAFESC
jgi:hypothetical protein